MKTIDSKSQTAWAVNHCAWTQAEELSAALGIPMVAAMVLAGRGLTDPDAARAFLDCSEALPDPFLFTSMQAVTDTLENAIKDGRKIVVHGDYDADGITATALLQEALGELGADVDWYLPNRFEEGYGLSRDAVEAIVARGANILITVDCGVNYPDEVALAGELGLEVVVVDHHQPGARLPDCHLIHHARGEYPHADLCGVGLALKVMHALHIQRFGVAPERVPQQLEKTLDLVAIGTIADLAPVTGENRYYVREGLRLLNVGQRQGLRALAQIAGCPAKVDAGAIAFRLAPRLNAAGRLADPSPPLRLLLTTDGDEAESLAGELHELNSARQDLERKVFEEAVRQVESARELPPALVLGAPEWHEGVVGIVAARLVERYHRPTVLLNVGETEAKGSGRSIPGYDLHAGLTECQHLLRVFGGHTQAVGLSLESSLVDEFREALQADASRRLAPGDLIPTYRADAVVRGEELNADTARALADLEPFGMGNPRPRLLMVDAALRDIERTRNGLHLRCHIQQDGVKIPGVAFGMGHRSDLTTPDDQHRLLGGQLRLDEWRGNERVQFQLEHLGDHDSSGGLLAACDMSCPHALVSSEADPCSPSLEGSRTAEMATTADWPPPCRDRRNKPGRVSAVAQVLAAGEMALVLTCSLAHARDRLGARIPLETLVGDGLVCVGSTCVQEAMPRLTSAKVVVAEWDCVSVMRDRLAALTHAIAIDPPFRPSHVGSFSSLAETGATLHLAYGEEERTDSARLMRYLVHPRFAMVCVYRAMQEGLTDRADLFRRAASLAKDKGRVTLRIVDLERAYATLCEIGFEQPYEGRAKLEADNTASYREAEAEYEESVRLCLTL